MADKTTAVSVLEQITHAEIDVQIATAKKYPRDIKHFKDRTRQLACLDEETAASMFYVLPRDGKRIEGPSVRFAEIIGSGWGNLRYGARIIEEGDKFVVAQGICHDLETNNSSTVEARRRITKKNGQRYGDDMIQTTANAAMSVALRNAIFKIVPFALVKDIYEDAKQTAIGKAQSMSEKRHKALDHFSKLGGTQEQVLAFLGKPGIDDIDIDDLIALKGLATAIKDGDTTVEQALAVEPTSGGKATVDPDANERLNVGEHQGGEEILAARVLKGCGGDIEKAISRLDEIRQERVEQQAYDAAMSARNAIEILRATLAPETPPEKPAPKKASKPKKVAPKPAQEPKFAAMANEEHMTDFHRLRGEVGMNVGESLRWLESEVGKKDIMLCSSVEADAVIGKLEVLAKNAEPAKQGELV